MVTGINFSTGSVFSEVYLNDNRLGNHNTDLPIDAGTYNFEMRASGCDPIKLNGIVVVDGQITRIGSGDSRMQFVRFWTPPDHSVWQGISMIPYRCEGSVAIYNGYNGGGVACYGTWQPVIDIAHSLFDNRMNASGTGIKPLVQSFVDSQTKIAVDSINSMVAPNLLSKLKETIAWYKSVIIGDSTGSWEFSKPLLNSYETPMKVATAEWQWWVVGTYRDHSSLLGISQWVVDPTPQKTIDTAVSILQSKLDAFGTWLFDIVQAACDKVAMALSSKYNTVIVPDINKYVDNVSLPVGFIDSTNLRSGFVDVRTELDKKLNEYSRTLGEMFSISSATTSSFASSRIAAVSRLNARINNRPIIRLTGNRTTPTINWSGTNRFGVEVKNVGGKSCKLWFGYRFIDQLNNEYVYNTLPSSVPVVASGETVMLNTDIPFDKLFPVGSPGKLRVKLIPIRSDA